MKSLFAIIALLTFVACADPCTQLSQAVCDCKPNEPEKTLCLEQVRVSRAAKTEGVLEAEALACEALLDACTCEKLAEGNLAACGLSP